MGGRSRAAAQLLAGQGFKKVYNLKGGIAAWNGLTAAGPSEMGMASLSGDETSTEIITLAYGMEKGLGEFYSYAAKMTGDPKAAGLLTKLAKIEENHMDKLFKLYITLDPGVSDKETFESGIVSDMMEGGFTTEEFLEKNRSNMQTEEGVLDVAMMLEAQALDLYLRYSQKTKEEQSKTVLFDIAEEEKAHLTLLGNLLEANHNE